MDDLKREKLEQERFEFHGPARCFKCRSALVECEVEGCYAAEPLCCPKCDKRCSGCSALMCDECRGKESPRDGGYYCGGCRDV